MALDLEVLRAEIDGTPALAVLVAAGRDDEVAAALNEADDAIRVPRRVSLADVLTAAVVPSEMPSPSTPERSYLDVLSQQRAIALTADLVVKLADVFGAGSRTAAAIAAMADRPGSRAEELVGQPITAADVSACYADERQAAYDASQATLDALKASLDAAVRAFVRAPVSERAAREADVRVAQNAIKAEHEKSGVIFDLNEEPSVIVLGR